LSCHAFCLVSRKQYIKLKITLFKLAGKKCAMALPTPTPTNHNADRWHLLKVTCPMKIDKRKIRELAKREIKAGKSKEAVFMEIYAMYNDFRLHEPIARIIQYIPEPRKLKQYGIYNTLFLLLLIGLFIALIITSNFEGLILIAILTYLVAARKTEYYQWITFVGVIFIISICVLWISGASNPPERALLAYGGMLFLSIIFILFGIYIPKLLTPDYKTIEETITNSEGEQIEQKRLTFN